MELDVCAVPDVGLVVLDRLTPPQRVAFVLHEVFSVPFDAANPLTTPTTLFPAPATGTDPVLTNLARAVTLLDQVGYTVTQPLGELQKLWDWSRSAGVAVHLDGARIWNAAVASGRKPAELAAPFDLVGVSLSKGLGAPIGSLLAGSRALLEKCVRHRRMLGGAMRQAGLVAAAGIYALDNNYERLAEDHANARLIAERLGASPRVSLDMATVQTNIVVFHLKGGAPDAATVVARAKELGVLLFAFGARTVRLATHLDVTREQCAAAWQAGVCHRINPPR